MNPNAAIERLEQRALLSISFNSVATGVNPGGYRAFGDLNTDGVTDLIVAGVFVTLYAGDGEGRFNPQPFQTLLAGAPITGVALADLDHDGDNDIAVSTIARITIFKNLGSGNFAERTFVNTAGGDSQAVVAGDFNYDGHVDLLTANHNEWSPGPSTQQRFGAGLLLGIGDATFQPIRQIALPSPQTAIEAPTLDSPYAAPSRAVAFQMEAVPLSYAIVEFTQSGLPIVSPSPPFRGWISSVAIGDLNRDGRIDFAVQREVPLDDYFRYFETWVDVYLRRADGRFAVTQRVKTELNVGGFDSLSILDFDRDGSMDILVNGAIDIGTDDYWGMVIALPGADGGIVGAPINFTFTSYRPVFEPAFLNRDELIDVFRGSSALMNTSSAPRSIAGDHIRISCARVVELLDALI